jgi:membrane-associated phospholipid phosphatase
MNMEFSVLFSSEIFFGNQPLEILHSLDTSFGSFFLTLSLLAHNLGSSIFFLSLLAMVYLCFSPQLGSKLALGLLPAGILNSLVKFIVESPRPMNLSDNLAHMQSKAGEFSFGFPSGHVHTSIVIWGLIFLSIKNKYVKTFSLIVIIIMPVSRLYLGVHYLGDVLGSLILGIINLLVLLWFIRKFPDFPSLDLLDESSFSIQRKTRSLVLMVLAITLSPTLLYHPGLSTPHLASLDIMVSASAALGGFLVGSILMKAFVLPTREIWSSYVESDSPTLTLFIRLSTLVLMIFLFYLLPSLVLKGYDFYNHILVRYLRYFIAGLTIVYLTPLILFHWKNGLYLRKSLNA